MSNCKRPEYGPWVNMRQRCNNPRASRYENYGGRGVTVCDRWDDFPSFLQDVGDRPPGYVLLLDRGAMEYGPGTCRWGKAGRGVKSGRVQKDNTSGVSGVRWNPRLRKYEVRVGRAYVGTFSDRDEAILARKAAEKRVFG